MPGLFFQTPHALQNRHVTFQGQTEVGSCPSSPDKRTLETGKAGFASSSGVTLVVAGTTLPAVVGILRNQLYIEAVIVATVLTGETFRKDQRTHAPHYIRTQEQQASETHDSLVEFEWSY